MLLGQNICGPHEKKATLLKDTNYIDDFRRIVNSIPEKNKEIHSVLGGKNH